MTVLKGEGSARPRAELGHVNSFFKVIFQLKFLKEFSLVFEEGGSAKQRAEPGLGCGDVGEVNKT